MDDANLVEKLDLKLNTLVLGSVIVRMEEWENVLSCLFYRIWENRNIFKTLVRLKLLTISKSFPI
jgi:hypothetical protein